LRVLVVEGYGVKLNVRGRVLMLTSRGGRRVVPLAEVDRVVVTTSGVSITSSALRKLAAEGVDILVLDGRGNPVMSLAPPWISATVATRRAQYAAYLDEAYRVEMMKAFASSKMRNQASYLRHLSRALGERSFAEDAARIEEKAQQIHSARPPADEAKQRILSIEGAAAQIYWGSLAAALPSDVGFPGRDQDSPDQFNTSLNYTYGILYAESFRALAKFGLDPFAGFLHADRSGAEALVFDFVEMFRVSAVDSLLVKMFREGFRAEVRSDGYLEASARRRLAEEFYKWFERRAGDEAGEVKRLCDHLKSYALKLGRALREKSVYRGFVEVWRV